MRIIVAACVLALCAATAVAENLVLDDPIVSYSYAFNTIGLLHFCDFATVMTKPPLPMFIKLTASFITDDKRPKDHNAMMMYMVEASVDTQEVKVVTGRIVSDVFNSDLMATKTVDTGLGASYNIPSDASLALFTNLITMHRAYTLAVDFENNPSLTINVKPTAEMLNPSRKWLECSLAAMQLQKP